MSIYKTVNKFPLSPVNDCYIYLTPIHFLRQNLRLKINKNKFVLELDLNYTKYSITMK